MTEILNIDNLYDTYKWVEPLMPICEICGDDYNLGYYDIDDNFVGCECCITIKGE